MQKDFLQRFIFEDFPVRGGLIRLRDSWLEVLSISAYPAPIRALLGQALAAAGLLTSNLKFKGTLSLQIQSSGILRLLVAQCNDQGEIRGVGRYSDAATDHHQLPELLDQAVLAINLEPTLGGQKYQGLVPFQDGSLQTALEHYFLQSEQLETRIWLAVDDHAAAGMLIQKMPGTEPHEEDWGRINALASTIQDAELLTLDSRDLLKRLFHEEDVRIYKPAAMRFSCSCSREKVAGMLQALGHDEVQAALAESDPLEVLCEYCNRQYFFDQLDVSQLFAQDEVPPPVSGEAQ